ncbi:MAG: hypothetical protein JWL97_2350, partial [Gemmatimonadales bacterium]|nr:hypothetical protein [Gemmatimonadales bacterium]
IRQTEDVIAVQVRHEECGDAVDGKVRRRESSFDALTGVKEKNALPDDDRG